MDNSPQQADERYGNGATDAGSDDSPNIIIAAAIGSVAVLIHLAPTSAQDSRCLRWSRDHSGNRLAIDDDDTGDDSCNTTAWQADGV